MFIINFTVGLKRYHFLYIVVFSLLFSFSILYASDKFDISGIGKNVNGYDTEYSFKIDFRNVENEISPILYGIFFEDINFGADGGLSYDGFSGHQNSYLIK